MSKLNRYIKSLPPELKPATNPIVNALIRAWAGQDDEIMTQLANTKAQLFVKTAEGVYLDRQAANLGVARLSDLGLLDADFRNLVPNLSLKQKQVVRAFYDTMDVFWGPLFSRANIQTATTAPFAVSVGDVFVIKIDGVEYSVTAVAGDIANNGFATTRELRRIIGGIEQLTITTVVDQTTGEEHLNIRTNTPGPRGSVEVVSGFTDLGFVNGRKYTINDLIQRTVMYQVNAGELIIELPAVVPTLRRTLKGSHHFHQDATIEPPVAPTGGIWAGSFIYSTSSQPFLVTSQSALLESVAIEGQVVPQITVSDSTPFSSNGGKLIFNFGRSNEEQPVSYIQVPNSKTLLIDPGYTFQNTHGIGSSVNLLKANQFTPYAPRINGNDLAVYLTSPANARSIVQQILKTLTVAGITVRFLILLPDYRYLIDNPYTS